MSEQLIISIGREYGSGGHIIAEALSKRFDLPLYDRNLLAEITKEKNLDYEELVKYDESPRNLIFSRTIRGYSNSPEENIANMQFEYLEKEAQKGKSFVVVGRCAETVLKNYKSLISIFILADMDCKIKRIANLHNISELEAEALIQRQNKARKSYHNYFCTIKWGDSRNYDLSINSSRLGIEGTVNLLEYYIRERIK